MVQSLTLPALTSFSFSVPKPSYSATAVGFNCRVSRTRRTTVCAVAVAVAEATNPVLERRKSVSLYEVLRVNRDASAKEIKAAYRNLAKLYHPDAAAAEEEESSRPDPTRDFIEIHDAYATLSDPSARALYDLKLTVELRRRGIYPTRVKRSGFYPTRRWETDQCW